jgi:predicted flap endonuclease-1-like 5' DNA nuclease
MLYLLAATWGWLVAALALGLVIGFATTRIAKDATFAGHGVIVSTVCVLIGGFFIATLQTLPGRAGLNLELALLLATAYAIALPIGGGARALIAAAFPPAPVEKKPPHVVLRGAPKPVEEPAATAEPIAPPPPAPTETTPPPTPPTVAKKAAPSPTVASETAKKLPGARPPGLPAPRDGKPDDLSKIKGVGPKSVEKLHTLGVYHFDQIAAWTPEHVQWVGASLAVPGRLERGRWVAQARALVGEDAGAETRH